MRKSTSEKTGGELSLVAMMSGVAVLLLYNILLTTMQSILALSFKGDTRVSDSGLLAMQIGNIVTALSLLLVSAVDGFFVALVVSGIGYVLGAGLCLACIAKENASASMFNYSMIIMGMATGSCQVSQFAIASHGALAEYDLPAKVSLGLGLGGVITWLAGVIFQKLLADPTTQLMSRSAVIILIAVCGAYALIMCIVFATTFWGRTRSAYSLETYSYPGEVPNSNDPLFSETITQQRSVTGGRLESNQSGGATYDDDVAEVKGGWNLGIIYIGLCFVCYTITLTCFPNLGPLRWNLGADTIWFIGLFQISDVCGRYLAMMLPSMSVMTLSLISVLRLSLVAWTVNEVRGGWGYASKLLCIALIGSTGSWLFTVIIGQTSTSLKPNIALTASSCVINALLVGIVAGLWVAGRIGPMLEETPHASTDESLFLVDAGGLLD